MLQAQQTNLDFPDVTRLKSRIQAAKPIPIPVFIPLFIFIKTGSLPWLDEWMREL